MAISAAALYFELFGSFTQKGASFKSKACLLPNCNVANSTRGVRYYLPGNIVSSFDGALRITLFLFTTLVQVYWQQKLCNHFVNLPLRSINTNN